VQARFKIVQELNALSVIVYVRISMTQQPLMGHGLLITEASMSLRLEENYWINLAEIWDSKVKVCCGISFYLYQYQTIQRSPQLLCNHKELSQISTTDHQNLSQETRLKPYYKMTQHYKWLRIQSLVCRCRQRGRVSPSIQVQTGSRV